MSFNLDNWTKKDYQKYINYLIDIGEKDYKKFSNKLIDTKYEMLGIRLPILRNIAKDIVKGNYVSFLNISDNKYFEEVMINGFIISYSNSEEILDKYFYNHIDKIDNWSLCDSFCNSIKIVKNKDKYFEIFKDLTKSDKEYYIRVGLVGILSHYINDNYIDQIFKILDNINIDTYYVNMASSWLLCECFIKERTKTLKYLINSKLNNFAFNNGIQKCIESYRITKEDKDFLRTLKREK